MLSIAHAIDALTNVAHPALCGEAPQAVQEKHQYEPLSAV
jgi:hypothetical protein